MGLEPGSKACLKASTATGGSFNALTQMIEIGADTTSNDVESTILPACDTGYSTSYTQETAGIRGVTYTANGFWDDAGDTTGQRLILDNAVSGADLWLQYFFGDPSDAHSIKSQANVASFEIKVSPDKNVEVDMSMKSTGTITVA